MNVLFYRRANYDEIPGGDLTQLTETARALRKNGVRVDISSDPAKNLSNYDIVHAFNSPRFPETLSFMLNARVQNIPVAFSTIFWSKEELELVYRPTAKFAALKKAVGYPLALKVYKWHKKRRGDYFRDNPAIERLLFELADILLPNSEGEMRLIETLYDLRRRPYAPVRNAVNTALFKKEPSKVRKPYVLSVGRLDDRKNVLALIEACRKIGAHLVLIGGADPSIPYVRRCLEAVKRFGFEHIGNTSPQKLRRYYYEAQVHAMVSWYETPGLSSMEAACGGCTIVSTDRGSTKEYFKHFAEYCNPASPRSIRRALRRALAAEPSFTLRRYILKEYTWSEAAADTLKGYKRLLKRTPTGRR